MVSKTRAVRIAGRIRQELADLLVMRAQDPRLAGVSVTDVEVDRELAFATIFVSAVEGIQREAEIMAGLDHAHGFLRSELAKRIELRVFPRLRFRWDPTPERAEAMEKLLSSLQQDSATTLSNPEDENQPGEDFDG